MNKSYMLRMKSNKANGASSPAAPKGGATGRGPAFEAAGGWEVRPGGMLVQKRTSDCNQSPNHVPNIKVRVKFGLNSHEVVISSQASFGELKKMLVGPTGLHTQDQKLIYKEKERDSKCFLDSAGIKNGSKILLIEDDLSRERRLVESCKNTKLEMASKEIEDIRFEVDKLAKQVASIELEINGGKKVVETVLLSLIELLMTQLIKLDGIAADGDVKLQRRMQVKRVQKYIENLDVLKIRNSGVEKLQHHSQIYAFQKQKELKKNGNLNERFNPGAVVVTTKWETF